MAVQLLPRDVRTCWNSTYNMLVVAVQYKEVLNALTADCNLPLWRYKLSDNDWAIIEDLVYTLEVCASFDVNVVLTPSLTDLQEGDTSILLGQKHHCERNYHHGQSR
jgi:hypothetical protein